MGAHSIFFSVISPLSLLRTVIPDPALYQLQFGWSGSTAIRIASDIGHLRNVDSKRRQAGQRHVQDRMIRIALDDETSRNFPIVRLLRHESVVVKLPECSV